MGDRTADFKEQQCQVNGCSTGKHNKCWGMEEAAECLQGRKFQTQKKGMGKMRQTVVHFRK